MRIFLLFFLSLSFIDLNSQTYSFFNQRQIDTFHENNLPDYVLIAGSDTNDPINNINNLISKNFDATQELYITGTSILNLDLSLINLKNITTLGINSNKQLKDLIGLNKLKFFNTVRIYDNDSLLNVLLEFDSLDFGNNIRIYRNNSMKNIQINFKDSFHFDPKNILLPNYDGFGLFVNDNNSLKRIRSNFNIGNGAMSKLYVENNKLLDSIIVNKFNSKRAILGSIKEPNSDTYKLIMNDWISSGEYNDLGIRISLYNNDSLKFLGGGFHQYNYDLVMLTIKNNPILSNLCSLQQKIIDFPNPKSNITSLYNINSNSKGANSIEEVVDQACTPKSIIQLNHNNANIRISPNPAFEYLYVSGLDKSEYDIKINSLVGQIVYHSLLTEDNAIINLPVLPYGYYIVSVNGKDLNINEKILINR